MSKVGRRPIDVSGITVKISGQTISYKGKNVEGDYTLPSRLQAVVEGDSLNIRTAEDIKNMSPRNRSEINCLWGLHRSLINNTLSGSKEEFVRGIEIHGLGYKVAQSGSDLIFSLGFSHKINFPLPEGISVEIEKNGQKMKVKSADKFLVGQVCSDIRALRPPEPYKGKGIRYAGEEIIRKQSKAKSA